MDVKLGALSDLAFDADRAAVRFDDFLRSHQSQSRAVFFCREKGREEFLVHVGFHTDARVTDAKRAELTLGKDANLQRAAFGHGLRGVLQEVEYDLL